MNRRSCPGAVSPGFAETSTPNAFRTREPHVGQLELVAASGSGRC